MWENIKKMIGLSAPVIGGLVGGKGGELVGSLISSALGVENTAEAIEKELSDNPDAIIKIKQLELEHAIELKRMAFDYAAVECEERKAQSAVLHATMQAELASNDAYVRRWRPTFGYSFCLAWTLLFFGLFWSMIAAPEKSAALIASAVSLTPLFGLALTVLGINIHKRSVDKQTMAGLTPGSVIATVKDAIKSR